MVLEQLEFVPLKEASATIVVEELAETEMGIPGEAKAA